PRIPVREARTGLGDRPVTEEIAEDLDSLYPERLIAEDRDPTRHGNVIARTNLPERLPAVDGEKRMEQRGPDPPPQPGRDLEDWLQAVVDEPGGFSVLELPRIGERHQPPRSCADDLLDGA